MSENVQANKAVLVKTTSYSNPNPTIARKRILELMKQAFVDAEFWSAVYPNKNLRHDVAPCLFHIRLEHDIEFSYLLVLEPNQEIIGHVVIKPPSVSFAQNSALTLSLLYSSRLIFKILSWGYWATVVRIRSCVNDLRKDPNKSFDVSTAWKLEQLAIETSYRGQGFGKSIMKQCLQVVPPGNQIVLNTQNIANVRFYEKLGFTIAEHKNVQFQNETMENWCMHTFT